MKKPRITMSFNEQEIDSILHYLMPKSFLYLKFEKSKALLISRREKYIKNINKPLDKCNCKCYDCTNELDKLNVREMSDKEIKLLIKRLKESDEK